MRIRIQLFTLLRIRILRLFIVMQICNYWGSILSLQASIVSVHGPPRLHFESLKLLHFEPDRDPTSSSAVAPCFTSPISSAVRHFGKDDYHFDLWPSPVSSEGTSVGY
jgi:hypothetical protein